MSAEIIDCKPALRELSRWISLLRQFPHLQEMRPQALRILERRLSALTVRVRQWRRTGNNALLSRSAVLDEVEEIIVSVYREDGISREEALKA